MSRRLDRVNGVLRQEISRVLATELRDPRIPVVVSITQVDASGGPAPCQGLRQRPG